MGVLAEGKNALLTLELDTEFGEALKHIKVS